MPKVKNWNPHISIHPLRLAFPAPAAPVASTRARARHIRRAPPAKPSAMRFRFIRFSAPRGRFWGSSPGFGKPPGFPRIGGPRVCHFCGEAPSKKRKLIRQAANLVDDARKQLLRQVLRCAFPETTHESRISESMAVFFLGVGPPRWMLFFGFPLRPSKRGYPQNKTHPYSEQRSPLPVSAPFFQVLSHVCKGTKMRITGNRS